MKNILKPGILLLVSVFCLNSCGSSGTGAKPAVVGAPYELLVICDQYKWNSEVGDTIREIMGAPVEGLNQREPMFTILRILPKDFNKLLKRNRNILNVVTGEDYKTPSITAQYDVYANTQIIVTVSGPDEKSITEYMSEHRAELTSVFEISERDRSTALNAKYKEAAIEAEIYENFNFTMNIPKGYKKRNAQKDFMWISMEHPTASQGVVIYRYPYTGKEVLSADSLTARRNQFVSLIPGENPGSHMITYDGFAPQLKHKRINGRYWAETRGFWDVKNDYMGGPFINYTTIDTENNMVVSIDLYVYSPDKPKRNFLKALEHLIYSASFPGDKE